MNRNKIVAILNRKGGVCKTTTTHNLGVALAERGYRVLLVDCDTQRNLSISLGINRPDEEQYTLCELLQPLVDVDADDVNIHNCIHHLENGLDLESFTAINKTAYNAVIGYNPAAAPYYEQILAQMRSHKEVPSFTHFFSALAPVHQMSGIPGEYKLDLVNTNPNCDLNDFNFAEQADVFFVKDKQVLHVSSAAAISADTLFSAFKGSVGETNSLIFWSSTDQIDQIRATADVLDPVPAYFRLSTEDVGEYGIEISKYETGTDLPLAGAEFEVSPALRLQRWMPMTPRSSLRAPHFGLHSAAAKIIRISPPVPMALPA